MMRLLLTGGAGFIGRHLCKVHLDAGDEVICLDNFFTSTRRNIEEFLPHSRFEFVRHDVCEPFHFDVDAVYHLACPAAPLHYVRNGARTLETSVVGTLNALRCARETGARMLFTSTSEVYGNPAVHPQREDYWGNVNPVGMRAVYDEGKRAAEALCAVYARQYGVDVRIARVFNTYGPWYASKDGRVIPAFLDALRDGEPIVVHGDGSQTRSFCFVDDTVEALRRLMLRPPIRNVLTGDLLPPVVNIGNPEEVTIRALARVACTVAGKPGHPVTMGRNQVADDPERRCPDISGARELLGWMPTVALEEGLRRTWEWTPRLR